ncbi:phosphodiester glycosidase family protein [Anaerovibrio sp. RM50]|uniref:phosphodiester glycosidase family protein n=1 Tax=Anaerovibrio sp. RM50 TaxID=1200557 RepID=UPI00068902C0|nr:phosphodiester glycosidase family protein [Anaerovibrio sp. RM50]
MNFNKKKIAAAVLAAAFTLNIAGLSDSVSYAAAKKTNRKPAVQTTQSVKPNKPSNNAQNAQTAQSSRQAVLSNIRLGDNATYTRVVLDMSAAKKYTAVYENNNTRLVITMDGVTSPLAAAPAAKGALKDIILAKYGDTLQIILDMKAAMPNKVYTLQNPNRIVIDVNKEYEEESLNQVEDGLLNGKYVRVDGRGMLTAYMLDIDPKKFDVKLALGAGNVSSGLRKLTTIASNNGAVAGVNGGYFDWSGDFLIGDIRINGKTAGIGVQNRTGLIKRKDGSYDIGRGNYSGAINVNGRSISFWGVNCPRTTDSVVMYNSLYGYSTGTNEFGTEYVIVNGRVQAINQGNSVIPANGVVVSVHGQSQANFAGLKVGDKATVVEGFGPEVGDAPDFYGAGPQLVANGKVSVASNAEQFGNDVAGGRAPRTAVGLKDNGHLLLMVVDGRQSHSIGASLTEMGQLLVKYGAVKGFNLDGGGSSEMILNNRIVNSPSEGVERRIGNAMLVMRKN